MTYTVTCSCGDVLSVEAGSRPEAVRKVNELMTDEAVSSHLADKHPREKAAAFAQFRAELEKCLEEAA